MDRIADPPIIPVRHGGGVYPVYVEAGLLARLGELIARHLGGRRPFVIADATVARLYGGALGECPILTFPSGEQHKTRDTWSRLTDQLLAHGAGRDSAIVALGGGVAGDLAGFVAATFHRGIPVLHVPTTLLAMVDSSIGGKTGVDTGDGKNLVGAFHQPVAVVADPDVLATLDDSHYRAGLAEAVKHGWMLDAACFEWMHAEAPLLGARDPGTVPELIRRSVRLKAEVVANDEREADRRAVLNAGHTIAHAIECASGWTVPHGDAVSVGLALEAAIAVELGLLEPAAAARLSALLARLGLPVTIAEVSPPGGALDPDAIVTAARRDKKNRRDLDAQGDRGTPDALRFALPAEPGRPHRAGGDWTVAVEAALVARMLSASPVHRPARTDDSGGTVTHGADRCSQGGRILTPPSISP